MTVTAERELKDQLILHTRKLRHREINNSASIPWLLKNIDQTRIQTSRISPRLILHVDREKGREERKEKEYLCG